MDKNTPEAAVKEDEKKYIAEQLDKAAKLFAKGTAIVLELKRRYNGRRKPI